MSFLNIPKSNNWFDNVVNFYLIQKANISQNVFESEKTKLAELPKFYYVNPLGLIDNVRVYISQNFIYKSDPITFDYYTHPRITQWQINNKNQDKYSCDCDDYASYAYAVLAFNGFNKDSLTVCTILPEIFPNIQDIKWCHVIMVGKNDNKIFVIDTNGLKWFDNSVNVSNEILAYFSTIYKVKYTRIINHGYPFKT